MKYWTVIFGLISIYSWMYLEKYHVLIPIIFTALTIIGISFLIVDRNVKR